QVAFPNSSYGAARVGASRLVAKDNIREEIRAARAEQQRRTRITADKVLREIARVAFSDLIDLFDDEGRFRNPRAVPLEARHAIASVRVSRERVTRRVTRKGKTRTTTTTRESVLGYRLWNKLDALGKLAKHLGLNVEITPPEALLTAMPAELA